MIKIIKISFNVVLCAFLQLFASFELLVSASSLCCGLMSLLIQALASVTASVWCIGQEEGRWRPSPHPQNHLGPRMSSYSQPQPPSGAQREVKVLSPFTKSGTLLFPRDSKLPGKYLLPFLSCCVSQSAQHLKDLGLGPSKGGQFGAVKGPRLQPWVCARLRQHGSVSKIIPALGRH